VIRSKVTWPGKPRVRPGMRSGKIFAPPGKRSGKTGLDRSGTCPGRTRVELWVTLSSTTRVATREELRVTRSGTTQVRFWVVTRVRKWKQCDVDINTSVTSTPTHNQISCPITWARAHQLNNQVSSFLASYSSYLDNGNMCFVLLLRNGKQEENGVAYTLVTFRFKNSSIL
jgi:hypothetical protein